MSEQPEQYVVVTHYQPPGDKPPVVHVWGPYPSRSKAVTAMRRSRREDEREHFGEDFAGVTHWVRKMLDGL